MLTLRLNAELENNISHIAGTMNLSKSEFVRISIDAFIKNLEKHNEWNAWEVGKDIFGKYSSEDVNLAQDRKSLLTKRLLAKNCHK
ncbi:hypothetical protein SPONL_1369 [uncultured Candidatus Thioglobus sp.]|nr:hypothetical protein SPONL_1369 [uncultured Candidatus Thioglobus sp.]